MSSPVDTCFHRFQENSQSLPVNRSALGTSHLVPDTVIARAIRIVSKNAVPQSCLTSFAEHTSISKPEIQTQICSKVSTERIHRAWEPLCSWIGFLLQVDPRELHGISKNDCIFAATASIHVLSRIFLDSRLVCLLEGLWKPGNALHTVGHLSDVLFGRPSICPFVASARVLRSLEAREDFFQSTSSSMIEDISTEIRARLELLEVTLLHDHDAGPGQIQFKEILCSLKSTMDFVNCLSHDARHRSVMLQNNIFVLGVQTAVAALEDHLLDTPFDLIDSTLRVLTESTLPLPYQMETLSQLIRGGLIHLLLFYLKYADEEESVLDYTESILIFIAAHTSNDSVSEALHEFLDDNIVEFDNDFERGVFFDWYLNQSYLAEEGSKVDTYLPPSCSSLRCSTRLTNVGSCPVLRPCIRCMKAAYCSRDCATEDWINLHHSECKYTDVELSDPTAETNGGRNLLPVCEKIFLWSIRNVAENFTLALFPGDTSSTSTTQNRDVTHCDMRCVPVRYDHSTFTSYVRRGEVYCPEYLRPRRLAYILRAMQNRLELRLVEFVFPYGTQAVVIVALLSLCSGRLPRYKVVHNFTHIIPISSDLEPSATAEPIYLYSDGPLSLPLAGRASLGQFILRTRNRATCRKEDIDSTKRLDRIQRLTREFHMPSTLPVSFLMSEIERGGRVFRHLNLELRRHNSDLSSFPVDELVLQTHFIWLFVTLQHGLCVIPDSCAISDPSETSMGINCAENDDLEQLISSELSQRSPNDLHLTSFEYFMKQMLKRITKPDHGFLFLPIGGPSRGWRTDRSLPSNVFLVTVSGDILLDGEVHITCPWILKKHCSFIVSGPTEYEGFYEVSPKIEAVLENSKLGYSTKFPSNTLVESIQRSQEDLSVYEVTLHVELEDASRLANFLMSLYDRELRPVTHLKITFEFERSPLDRTAVPENTERISRDDSSQRPSFLHTPFELHMFRLYHHAGVQLETCIKKNEGANWTHKLDKWKLVTSVNYTVSHKNYMHEIFWVKVSQQWLRKYSLTTNYTPSRELHGGAKIILQLRNVVLFALHSSYTIYYQKPQPRAL
ncbi:hypothetical protein DFP72DRAFT_845137 [Ephemerocybe angulata]|uniref:MYND-type domain-containing protein n=1 Tax=Ephemerocybe angulata TaxID=980116 RepID=A0A8H6I3J1_9AGAR|nr:hypothetical protein DFP72DRAFT_845137 [Tulosesus angulatus]